MQKLYQSERELRFYNQRGHNLAIFLCINNHSYTIVLTIACYSHWNMLLFFF